jgi:hypothetical protein
MDLNQQIQVLIDNAPQDGTTPRVIQAIAPALKSLAGQLQHSQYYILQSANQSWVITTLSHRTQPALEKTVIYAYPTPKDAAAGPFATKDPQVVAEAVPVTHILFQMVAMQPIDSVVFFETAGDLTNGREISRASLNDLIEEYLKRYQAESQLPPDIA